MGFLNKILDFFNPQGIKCVVCGVDTEKHEHGVCLKCKKALPLNDHVCLKCGVDIRTMNDFCDMCGKNQLAFDEYTNLLFDENFHHIADFLLNIVPHLHHQN